MLLTGISASGKSTIGELLAQRFPRGVHVRGDQFRKMVRSGRADMTADPSDEARRQLRLRYRIAAGAVDEYFDAGFSVVVQDVVLGTDLTGYVESIRSRPLMVVVLAPRVEVVAQREASRQKVACRDGALSAAALDDALRTQTPPLGLWLDSSEQSPDETVDEIARRSPEARVTTS
jgi:cytidylate kinase